MRDILKELDEAVAEIENGVRNIMTKQELYPLLARAADEIKRLREVNSDMGWRLNPDRMGGQFSEEEKNRSGWL
jgi:hypothetical protein